MGEENQEEKLLKEHMVLGLLDAGRGSLAAVLASLGTFLFAWSFPDGYQAASMEERRQVMVMIIGGYTLATFPAGVFA